MTNLDMKIPFIDHFEDFAGASSSNERVRFNRKFLSLQIFKNGAKLVWHIGDPLFGSFAAKCTSEKTGNGEFGRPGIGQPEILEFSEEV